MYNPDVPADGETAERSAEWLRNLTKEFRDPLCVRRLCSHPRSEHTSRGCNHVDHRVQRHGSEDLYYEYTSACACTLTAHEISINVMMKAQERLQIDDLTRRTDKEEYR